MYIEVSDRQTGKTTRLMNSILESINHDSRIKNSHDRKICAVLVCGVSSETTIKYRYRGTDLWSSENFKLFHNVDKFKSFIESNLERVVVYVDDVDCIRHFETLINGNDPNTLEYRNCIRSGFYTATDASNISVMRLLTMCNNRFYRMVRAVV